MTDFWISLIEGLEPYGLQAEIKECIDDADAAYKTAHTYPLAQGFPAEVTNLTTGEVTEVAIPHFGINV